MVRNTICLPLEPEARLQVAPAFHLPDELIAQVGAIWAKEKQCLGSSLVNGRIFSLMEYRTDLLTIQSAEYCHALARRLAPELVNRGLLIRPLAVTGILEGPDGIVFGQRCRHVAADAGAWEPAPAGGLANPDPIRQVLEELAEEVGLASDWIIERCIRGLVEDRRSGVVDIVVHLRTQASAHEILDAHRTRASLEYDRLAIVPRKDLPGFVSAPENNLLPVLKPMLKLAGLLSADISA